MINAHDSLYALNSQGLSQDIRNVSKNLRRSTATAWWKHSAGPGRQEKTSVMDNSDAHVRVVVNECLFSHVNKLSLLLNEAA